MKENEEHGIINFVLIGAKNTGKTTYLASLDLNIKQIRIKGDDTGVYLHPIEDKLDKGKNTDATEGVLHELKFVHTGKNKFESEIQIDDVDGLFVENMSKSKEDEDRHRETFSANIKKAEGVIFFFPYEKSFSRDTADESQCEIGTSSDKATSESIKNFRAKLSSVIEKIKEHSNIPTVIVVSKWDKKSPDYKAENEDEKVREYINGYIDLERSHSTIETSFSNLKIIPISSRREDGSRNNYNILEPINFLVKETYRIWEERIKNFQDDRDKLKFLAKVHFDMKGYKENKYIKEYEGLEKKYAKEILANLPAIESTVGSITKYKEFEEIKKKYQDIIPSLSQENIDKIEEIDKKLKKDRTYIFLKFFLAIAVFVMLVSAWYNETELMKTESECFSDISIKFQNLNYKEAMEDVEVYQSKFKNTLNADHKSKVEEIRSKITKHYTQKLATIIQYDSLLKQNDALKLLYRKVSTFETSMDISPIENKHKEIQILKEEYQKVLDISNDDISKLKDISLILNQLSSHHFTEVSILKKNFQGSLVAMGNNLVSEVQLDNVDVIDDLLGAFIALNINNPEIVKKLTVKKNKILVKSNFDEIKHTIEHKNFQESLDEVENRWSDYFDDNKKSIIQTTLDKKFNSDIEIILKKIASTISGIDEYNNLNNKLSQVMQLKENVQIAQIAYTPTTNSINQIKIDEKKKTKEEYARVLSSGISSVQISFGARSSINEPLGFQCGGNHDEITLTIDTHKYSYKRQASCYGLLITWRRAKVEARNYSVIVEEHDYASFDDVYRSSLTISQNDLIKIYNGEKVKKEIGSGYFIRFKKN